MLFDHQWVDAERVHFHVHGAVSAGRAATFVDPRYRLLATCISVGTGLECCWHCVLNGGRNGVTPDPLRTPEFGGPGVSPLPPHEDRKARDDPRTKTGINTRKTKSPSSSTRALVASRVVRARTAIPPFGCVYALWSVRSAHPSRVGIVKFPTSRTPICLSASAARRAVVIPLLRVFPVKCVRSQVSSFKGDLLSPPICQRGWRVSQTWGL